MKKTRKLLCASGALVMFLCSSPVVADDISVRMGTIDVETNPNFTQTETTVRPSLVIDDISLEELLRQGGAYPDNSSANRPSGFVKVPNITDGWVLTNGKWQYYVDGNPVVGWRYIDGEWYYFGADTYMVTGWRKISEIWYYFKTDGAMVTGTVQIGSEIYYFEDSGGMYQGLYPSSSAPTCYYGHPDDPDAGAKYMAGWLHVGEDWYYANPNTGTLFSGESELDYKRFYFMPTLRTMCYGNITINGEERFYDDNASSENYGVLWEGVYDVVTYLSEFNEAEAELNNTYIENLGYVASMNLYPLPMDTYLDLPTRKISIVHGHGAENFIRFDGDDGNEIGRFYGDSNTRRDQDVRISDYDTNALEFADLVIYTSCFSACNDDSVAPQTYSKGAKTVLGYKLEVSYGEYFSAYILNYLNQGLTLNAAKENAIVSFDLIFPDMSSNETRASNPDNMVFFGEMNHTYKINS